MKSSSGFDNILEALIQQKQVLQDLQSENESLRQQLADLRAGHGVFIEILGTRIPLTSTPDAHDSDGVSDENAPSINVIEETAPVPAVAVAPPVENDAWLLDTSVIQLPEPDPALQETTMVPATGSDLTLQPTASISSEDLQAAEQAAPLPSSASDFVIEDVSENESESPVPAGSSSSFLEDAMLAEFATASTRHVGNWSGPITNNPIPNGPITNNPDLDEEAKAALRRELMGSYILE
jgi:hypothetical protein